MAVNDAVTTVNGVAVTIPVLANDTDPDGRPIDPSTLTISSHPTRGTAVVNADGTITYTPTQHFFGTDSFTYTVADTQGAVSNRATVTITIPCPIADGPDRPDRPRPTTRPSPTDPTEPTEPDRRRPRRWT